MILLREIQLGDLDGLERLAQIPGFINLQNDRDFLQDKIQRSIDSFCSSGVSDGHPAVESKYIFVAEDLAHHTILGTAMIAGQHGTDQAPHFYFQVGSEERFSQSIGTGFIHGTLELRYDTEGPSEIGGLVLAPESRGSDAKIGRQISFVRFLYLATHRERFHDRILAELLPPLNKKGQSPLWEAIGRRFTNMDYWEADRLCQQDKEFIFSLFPEGKIYATFLSAEARNSIGKVGKETEPVFHMLNKIGFRYHRQVDPFDGGPHLWADTDEIVPVKRCRKFRFAGAADVAQGGAYEGAPVAGLICPARQEPGQFRAVHVTAVAHQGDLRVVEGPDVTVTEVSKILKLVEGDEVAFMPYY